jgi:membrane protease YdiL (CAAX protease family)
MPSLARLIFRTVVDVVLIAGLAVAITAPMLYTTQARFLEDKDGRVAVLAGVKAIGLPCPEFERLETMRYRKFRLECVPNPAAELKLIAWAEGRPGAIKVNLKREKPTKERVLLDLTFLEPSDGEFEKVPWEEFGFVQNGFRMERRHMYLESQPLPQATRLYVLGCLQLAILALALGRFAFTRAPRLPLWGGSFFAAIGWGLAAGLLLAGLTWVYDAFLRMTVGPSAYTSFAYAGAWLDEGIAYQKALPWIVLGMVVGSPLFQELYFRGSLYAAWAGAGRRWLGLFVVAVFAAVVRLDWWHFPLVLAWGLVLGEVFRRARHLLAPIIAHMAAAGMLVALLAGVVPSYPDAQTRMIGTWVKPGSEAETLTITADGQAITTTFENGEKSTSTDRLEWLGRDTFRVRDSLLGIPLISDFRIGFEGDEMTWTVIGGTFATPGHVVKKRRVK